MARKRVQTRLPEPLADKLEEYREANHMNQAEAVRHLLRAGLDAETPDEPGEVEAAIDEATEAAVEDDEEPDATTDEIDVFGINTDARTLGGLAVMVILAAYITVQGGASTIAAALAAFVGGLLGAML